VLPLLVTALGVAWAGGAGACPLEVIGSDRSRWQGAAATTAAVLANEAGRHCASVSVETTAAGAVLRLTTRDGRLAVRQLHDPVELLPAVQALTVPATEPREGPEREPAVLTRNEPRELEGAARRDPYANRPIVGAALGFRIGADRLITPTISASLSLLQAPIELGILARFEAHYVNTRGGNQNRPDTSGLAFGAHFGVRQPVAPLALRGGLLLLVVALREDNKEQGGRAEARFGGYFGAVWPAQGKLRLRTDIAIDLVPYNVGRSETNALGESSLPWWGVGFSLGLEAG
jgi:hypothetical protein